MSAQATPHTFPIHPQDTLPETDTLGGQEPPELGKVTVLKEPKHSQVRTGHVRDKQFSLH